jgi:hypothetical protein
MKAFLKCDISIPEGLQDVFGVQGKMLGLPFKHVL